MSTPPEPTKFPHLEWGRDLCFWEAKLGMSVGKREFVLTCEWRRALEVNLGAVGRTGTVPVCVRAPSWISPLMGGGDA